MTTPDSKRIDRTKVAPFLVRTFIKPHPGHRTSQFDSPELPTQDEYQIYTWMDSTLQELLITLRALCSPSPLLISGDPSVSNPHLVSPGGVELHHPLAKYIFRALYPDPTSGGRFQSRELGVVYARDLSDPTILETPFQTFPETTETPMEEDQNIPVEESVPGLEPEKTKHENGNGEAMDTSENVQEKPKRSTPEPRTEDRGNDSVDRDVRTLQDLRFHKGDYLAISIVLPKSTSASAAAAGQGGGGGGGGGGPGMNIRGSASRGALGRDAGAARPIPWVTSPSEPNARGGRDIRGDRAMAGNWRGGAPGPSPTSGRGGGFGSRGDVPVNRRDTRDGRGSGRGGRHGAPGGRRGRSLSKSRSRSKSKSRSRDRSMVSSPSSRSRSRSPPPRRD